VLICHTNALATGTWHQRYYHFRDECVDVIGASDKLDLYLLTAPDVPFVQDGFRAGESLRDGMHECFKCQLAKGHTGKVIEGSYAELSPRNRPSSLCVEGSTRSASLSGIPLQREFVTVVLDIRAAESE
jgi:nicotinamide riboside kinase